MLSINDLKTGSLIAIDDAPFQVIEVAHQHIGRGGSSIQTKIRNLKTGQVLSRNFKPAYVFEEADIEKRPVKFLYQHRGEYVFMEPEKTSASLEARPDVATRQNRFPVREEVIGENKKWLKPNIELTGVFFRGELITFIFPIKMDFEVTEALPGIKGDRSNAGNKSAIIETEAIVQVPLFINTGDIIRINTETGEYVERVKKTTLRA